MSRQWSRSELAQQLRSEIMGYFGAASDFDERVAKTLKLSRTDVRCLDIIGRVGPLTAGRLAEESGLTTGAVTFILDRLEEAGMVVRRRDTEDRRRVWVEIVPQAKDQLADLQQPVADEMRQVAQHFKPDELEVVRDFMRRAKEVFQRQMHEAVHDSVHEARASAHETAREARSLADHLAREARKMARDMVHEAAGGSVHESGDADASEDDRREDPAAGK